MSVALCPWRAQASGAESFEGSDSPLIYFSTDTSWEESPPDFVQFQKCVRSRSTSQDCQQVAQRVAAEYLQVARSGEIFSQCAWGRLKGALEGAGDLARGIYDAGKAYLWNNLTAHFIWYPGEVEDLGKTIKTVQFVYNNMGLLLENLIQGLVSLSPDQKANVICRVIARVGVQILAALAVKKIASMERVQSWLRGSLVDLERSEQLLISKAATQPALLVQIEELFLNARPFLYQLKKGAHAIDYTITVFFELIHNAVGSK